MDFRKSPRMPPILTNPEGKERRVGVELEFAAISACNGARLVQSVFGGSITEEDPHRFHIKDTELGSFTCELDTQYAHRAYGDSADMPRSDDSLSKLLDDFRDEMRRIYGEISSIVVPCEIVCPPIALTRLTRLEELVKVLTEAGAEGTRISPFYAFGAQLNPEIASEDVGWLTSVLKAYLLASEWLRSIMQIDTTRRLVAFADPFPTSYVMKVVDPGYWPNRERLINDYLRDNPTRNRELDMLPLFAWLDPVQVRRAVPDPRVKPRPAFHYRLPDANIGEPDWGVMLEWNRWCVVEVLAERRETLNAMGSAYQTNLSRLFREDWAIRASEWLVLS
jgi:hypothetical protein